MEDQNPVQNSNPVPQPIVPPTPEPDIQVTFAPSFEPKKLLKWIVVAIIVVVLIIASGAGAYFLNKNSAPKTQTPTPSKTTNSLNPNTGNLYNDIKVRLNEVLK